MNIYVACSLLIATWLGIAFILIPAHLKVLKENTKLKTDLLDQEQFEDEIRELRDLIEKMKAGGRERREKVKNLREQIARITKTKNHKDQEIQRLRAEGYNVNAVVADSVRVLNNLTYAVESLYHHDGYEKINKKNLCDFTKIWVQRYWEEARHIGNNTLDISITHVEKILDWMNKENAYLKIIDQVYENIIHNITEFREYGDKGDIGFHGLFSNEDNGASAEYFKNALLQDGFPEDLITVDTLLFINRVFIHPIGLVKGLVTSPIGGQVIKNDRVIIIAYDNRVNLRSMLIYPYNYIKHQSKKASEQFYSQNGMVKPD